MKLFSAFSVGRPHTGQGTRRIIWAVGTAHARWLSAGVQRVHVLLTLPLITLSLPNDYCSEITVFVDLTVNCI